MKHTIALLFLVATVLPSQAQRPAAPKPTTPAQNPAGVIPSVSNAAVPGGKPAAPVPVGVRGPQQVKQHNPLALACRAGQIIDGSNWDDQGVADAYSDYTGKRVLLSSATQNLEIRFYQRGKRRLCSFALLRQARSCPSPPSCNSIWRWMACNTTSIRSNAANS